MQEEAHPVQLREKKLQRQKFTEFRKSLGYFSPTASLDESPCHSTLALDSTGRTSVQSSGYNSPMGSSLDQVDEDDIQSQYHCKLLRTNSADHEVKHSASKSPLITHRKIYTLPQQSQSFESSHN